LQDKESINVCREALTDDLASAMAKVRAVQYRNRGSIPRKGKEFSLLRNVHTSSDAHPVSSMGIEDAFPWGKSGRSVRLTTHCRLVPSYLCTPSAIPYRCSEGQLSVGFTADVQQKLQLKHQITNNTKLVFVTPSCRRSL